MLDKRVMLKWNQQYLPRILYLVKLLTEIGLTGKVQFWSSLFVTYILVSMCTLSMNHSYCIASLC